MARLVDARSLVDAVREALAIEIVRGEIAPGAQLTELGIAERYDIARPTAKAAIDQLVIRGLLRRTLNKAARVPILDQDDIRDLYVARAMIERAIVGALAAKKIVSKAARKAIDRMYENDGDIVEIVASDIEYHRALTSSLGSPRAIRLHEAVIGEAHLCISQVQVHQLLTPTRIALEHTRILDAIEAGEVEDAQDLLEDHLARARERLIQHLNEPPTEVSPPG